MAYFGLKAQCLWWDVLGERAPGLCILCTAFLQPESISHALLCYLSCLCQVIPGWIGRVYMGAWGKWVCVSVPLMLFFSTGFNCKEYRPLRLKCCFCPSVIYEVKNVWLRGIREGYGWDGEWVVGRIPTSVGLFSP